MPDTGPSCRLAILRRQGNRRFPHRHPTTHKPVRASVFLLRSSALVAPPRLATPQPSARNGKKAPPRRGFSIPADRTLGLLRRGTLRVGGPSGGTAPGLHEGVEVALGHAEPEHLL